MEIESEDILVNLTEHVNVWSQETMACMLLLKQSTLLEHGRHERSN